MKLHDLKNRGAFVGTQAVRKPIEWTHADPQTGAEVTDKFDIFVRRLSFGDVERIYFGGDGDDERSRSAAVISARVLLGEDASERLSYEDAYQLDISLANAFMAAINEVGEKAAPAKN